MRRLPWVAALLFLPSGVCEAVSGAAQPQPLRPDIQIAPVATVQTQAVRLARDPSGETLYYLRRTGDIYEVDLSGPTETLLFTAADHGIAYPLGLEVAGDGTFFIVGSLYSGTTTVGLVRRASPPGFSWATVVETEPYALSGSEFDHAWNALAFSPDGDTLYVNSGSRTDHGEIGDNGGAFPGLRETAITSAILRVPASAVGLVLKNDPDSLAAGEYLFADGVRNTYDLAFNADGDLFGTENSGIRDDGDELNWLREGHHYGFPWRLGTNDTPQQDPGYDPATDLLLNQGSAYVGYFSNDPTYPPPPGGVVFTDPVANVGPHADKYREPSDGTVHDASDDGASAGTFTPHKSPLGLVFDTELALGAEFTGDGFLLGWTDSTSFEMAPFGDPGEDLLHLELTKILAEDRYEATITRLVCGFSNPIDAVQIGNRIYVLEFNFGASMMIWEVTLPGAATGVPLPPGPAGARLLASFPNPARTATWVRYHLPQTSRVRVEIHDARGRLVRELVDTVQPPGEKAVRWNGANDRGMPLGAGIYFSRLVVETSTSRTTLGEKIVRLR